jgi:hypothetical protein
MSRQVFDVRFGESIVIDQDEALIRVEDGTSEGICIPIKILRDHGKRPQPLADRFNPDVDPDGPG